MNEDKQKKLENLIKRSNLPTVKKAFWLKALPQLPEVLLDVMATHFSRLELLTFEQDVLDRLTSLPLEKMFDESEQEKVLMQLRVEYQHKLDLRKAHEVLEKFKD